jgi:putative hemolysin
LSEDTVKLKKTHVFFTFAFFLILLSFTIGYFTNSLLSSPSASPEGFSQDDKNFLISLSNAQLSLYSQILNSQNDWCTQKGGEWNITQQDGEFLVPEEQALRLEEQGAKIEKRDGNWFARVVLIRRDGCIFALPSTD